MTIGFHLHAFTHTLRVLLKSAGGWGPLLVLALFAVRGIFFFLPTTVLQFVSGTIYGPVFGTILNVIGENISAAVGFLIARLLGRRWVSKHEHGWIKKYDALLREDGFFAVLFMRLLFFPFDLVNYGSGLSSMSFQQYALGTFLGSLPAIITFTLLGNAFEHPRALGVFVILFLITVGVVLLARQSAWVRHKLFPPQHPPHDHS